MINNFHSFGTKFHTHRIQFMKKLTVLLLLFLPFLAPAQALDSLIHQLERSKNDVDKVKTLITISEESIYRQPDLTIKYSEQLLELSKKVNNQEGEAISYLTFARYYNRAQDFERSHQYLEKAERVFSSLKEPNQLLKVSRVNAENEMRKGNFEAAMKILQANIDKSKKLKNPTEEAINLAMIGNIFTFNQQFEEAEKQLLKSLTVIRKTTSKREESIILSNLASSYFSWQKNEEAKKYLDTFFVIQQQLNDPVLLASAKVNMANYYMYKGEFDRAINSLNEALLFYERINDIPKISFTLKRRADLYISLKEYQKAIADANTGIELLKDKNEMDIHIADYYYLIYQSYNALGNYKEAITAFETAYEYKAKAISSETSNTILELKEKYETEKKEEEIKLLQEQNKTKDALIKARTYSVIALSLLFLSILFGFILVRRQQKLKQQKRATELEHRALRAQMNPHFIFNALNSIQRVYVEGDTDKANDFMADFANLMRRVLENSGSTKISIQEEVDTLRLYMELEKLRSKDRFTYSISVEEDITTFDTQIPPLIIQPFVENAIWHGILPLTDRMGEIKVSIKSYSDNELLISITDNGIGFDTKQQTSKHHSKGIEITEQRIGEKVTVNSQKGQGTTISFTLKLTPND